MPQLVADVVAIADRLGAARIHLVGHDWGGVVAWRLAGRQPERVATLTAVSTPHPRAFARALVAGTQALRSAYIPVFRIPRLPELLLGATGSGDCAGCWPRTGWAPSGSTPTLAPWPNRARCRQPWPGTERPRRSACGPPGWGYRRCMSGVRMIRRWGRGRPPRPGAGSPAPTDSRSLLAPATGCPSTTPPSWVACCSSTLGVGRPSRPMRKGRPAEANAIEIGGGPPSRRRRPAGAPTSADVLDSQGCSSGPRSSPGAVRRCGGCCQPSRPLRDRRRLLIIKTAVGRHATAGADRS